MARETKLTLIRRAPSVRGGPERNQMFQASLEWVGAGYWYRNTSDWVPQEFRHIPEHEAPCPMTFLVERAREWEANLVARVA